MRDFRQGPITSGARFGHRGATRDAYAARRPSWGDWLQPHQESNTNMNKISTALVLALALAAPGAASAEGFSVRLGYLNVNPDSDNGRLAGAYDVEVEYDWSATIGASYFVTGNIAIDVQTALAKFKHDLKLTGGATGLPTLNDANLVGVEHRPTTIQAQWHFAPGEQFGPYIGAGYGWTSISVARNQTGLGTLDTDRADYGVQVGYRF